MTPVPKHVLKHRSYRFSLGALFALMTVVAIAVWVANDWRTEDPDEPVYIAATQPYDKVTAKLIKATLRANGIDCVCANRVELFWSTMSHHHNPANVVPGLVRRTPEQAIGSYLVFVVRRDSERGRALLRSPPLSGRQIEAFSVDIPAEEQ
jgi:hypothetical protein